MKTITVEMVKNIIEENYIVGGKKFESIFRMISNNEAEIGFKDGEKEFTIKITLPSQRKDGLYERNGTIFAGLSFLIPPLKFKVNSRVFFVKDIINDSVFAKSLNDFLPVLSSIKPVNISKLYGRLFPTEAKDINDVSNWIAIDFQTAILELFNLKITKDIEKYLRGNFKGVSTVKRSINTFINCCLKFYKSQDTKEVTRDYCHEDTDYLNPFASEENIFRVHPLIRQISLKADTPLDFCSSSQSKMFSSAKLKAGFEVKDYIIAGKQTFPYSHYRKAVVGVLSDDPRRVIVSNSIKRAMTLYSPDEPYAITDTEIQCDSLSMPGVRMTHPLTFHDGIVVSKTFAKKASAFKEYTDVFTITDENDFYILKEAFAGNSKEASRTLELNRLSKVMPDEVIAVSKRIEFRSKVKVPAVITSISINDDIRDDGVKSKTVKITSVAFLPLQVGDKLSDAHGNKGVVSAILPDEEMPIWENTRLHYIASPYVMKRLALGAEIEDKISLIGYDLKLKGDDRTPCVDHNFTMQEANRILEDSGFSYLHNIKYEGELFKNVPISLRRMFRLDNNAVETLSIKKAKLTTDLCTLYERGALNLTESFIGKNHHDFTRQVIPVLKALSKKVVPSNSFEISVKLPDEILGKLIKSDEFKNIPHSVIDSRIENMFGFVKIGREIIYLPPRKILNDLGNGLYALDRILVSFNRIIAEQKSSSLGYDSNIQSKVKMYYETLSTIFCGKNGLIKETLSGKASHSIRAVITPANSSDDDMIFIPRSAWNKIIARKEVREIYRKHPPFCLLKRDPVHRSANLITVRFAIWDNKTIGISPLLCDPLNADFDGDTGTVIFPENEDSMKDIMKMDNSLKSYYSAQKYLKDVPFENATEHLKQTIGIVSTFDNPHFSDELKNAELFHKLYSGISEIDLSNECIKASKDFAAIKESTAKLGALLLRLIYTRKLSRLDELNHSMDVYHFLSQKSLSSKSGNADNPLKVIDAFNNKPEKLKDVLNEMGYFNDEAISLLIKFRQEIKSSMKDYLLRFPILACIQNSASFIELKNLADKFENLDSITLWEKLFTKSLNSDDEITLAS